MLFGMHTLNIPNLVSALKPLKGANNDEITI